MPPCPGVGVVFNTVSFGVWFHYVAGAWWRGWLLASLHWLVCCVMMFGACCGMLCGVLVSLGRRSDTRKQGKLHLLRQNCKYKHKGDSALLEHHMNAYISSFKTFEKLPYTAISLDRIGTLQKPNIINYNGVVRLICAYICFHLEKVPHLS